MAVLLDTGPLVALINQREIYHIWSRDVIASNTEPLICCEPVMTEAAFLLSKTHGGIRRLSTLARSGAMQFDFRYRDHADRVDQLLSKYEDLPISFADACLVAMAEDGDRSLVTLDSDFRVYRTRERRRIRVIMPPDS